MANYRLTKEGVYYVLTSIKGYNKYLYPIVNSQMSFTGSSFGIGSEHGRNVLKF